MCSKRTERYLRYFKIGPVCVTHWPEEGAVQSVYLLFYPPYTSNTCIFCRPIPEGLWLSTQFNHLVRPTHFPLETGMEITIAQVGGGWSFCLLVALSSWTLWDQCSLNPLDQLGVAVQKQQERSISLWFLKGRLEKRKWSLCSQLKIYFFCFLLWLKLFFLWGNCFFGFFFCPACCFCG